MDHEDVIDIGPSKYTRYGFSLTELLVVITITCGVFAILLPSLNATRHLARRLSCGTNLRSIGLGLQLYQQDRESLPPQYDRWGPERQTYDNQHMEPWVASVPDPLPWTYPALGFGGPCA